MPRRVSMPAADDLFRPTVVPDAPETPEQGEPSEVPPGRRGEAGGQAHPSGRERHDEKITVYVSADELVDIEQARLVLRREHGVAVDRGRLVREAVAEMLVDLEAHGEDSVVVQRLTQAYPVLDSPLRDRALRGPARRGGAGFAVAWTTSRARSTCCSA